MNSLPKLILRSGAGLAIVLGLAATAQAAANPKAGNHPNPKSAEPHPGDTRSAEGKAKAEANKGAAHEKSALDRYDTNGNGKLDPDEVAAMQADKKSDKKTPTKKRGS